VRRIIPTAFVIVSFAAGCRERETGAAPGRGAELERELDALRAENARLREELAAKAGAAAAGNAKAIDELRSEFRAIRDELAAGRPEPPALIVDQEVEERLLQKVEQLKEAVWNSPPSGCVRILRTVIESHPNTRAALRAQGILGDWNAVGVEVTDGNAAGIDESIRAHLRSRSRVWRGIQEARRAAEAGEAEGAVRALREIADEHGDETGRHALELLENWGVEDVAIEDVDFAEVGPRIRRHATAQREIETAFRSLHRGRPEEAVGAFKEIIAEYPDLGETEQAREGLAQARERLRERGDERRRDGRAREKDEQPVDEDGERRDGERGDERPLF
jgi:hypothetical protein